MDIASGQEVLTETGSQSDAGFVVVRELTNLLRLHDALSKAEKDSRPLFLPLLCTIPGALIGIILATTLHLPGGWAFLLIAFGVVGAFLLVHRFSAGEARTKLDSCKRTLDAAVAEATSRFPAVLTAIGSVERLRERRWVVDTLKAASPGREQRLLSPEFTAQRELRNLVTIHDALVGAQRRASPILMPTFAFFIGVSAPVLLMALADIERVVGPGLETVIVLLAGIAAFAVVRRTVVREARAKVSSCEKDLDQAVDQITRSFPEVVTAVGSAQRLKDRQWIIDALNVLAARSRQSAVAATSKTGGPISATLPTWARSMLVLDTTLLSIQALFLVMAFSYGVRALSEPLTIFGLGMMAFGILGNTGLLRGESRATIPALVGFGFSLPVQFLLRLPLMRSPVGIHPDSWVAHHPTDIVVFMVAWSIVYDFIYFQSIVTARRSILDGPGSAATSAEAHALTPQKPTLKQLGFGLALTGIAMFIIALMIMLSVGPRLEGFLLGAVNGCVLFGPVFAIVGVVMSIWGALRSPKEPHPDVGRGEV